MAARIRGRDRPGARGGSGRRADPAHEPLRLRGDPSPAPVVMRKRPAPFLTLAIALASCGNQAQEMTVSRAPAAASGAGRPLVVYTVNDPLRYFAERIGGDRVEVVFPAPAGVDPAHWSPDPEIVAAYQRADRILLNGAGYARWVERATLRRDRLVDTSAGFAEQLIPLDDALIHSHGPKGDHSHEGFAFTTWLDPKLALEQAGAVFEAFVAARPDNEAAFRAGFDALAADLRALDERLASAAARIGDAPLLFSHPVYPYLARRYALNGQSLHWEPDQAPDETQWRELEARLAGHPAQWMIWEAAPRAETVRRLETMGLRALVYAPSGNAPDEGDFLSVMVRNVGALEAATRSPETEAR
ncbi:MAG: zinc ABC transporter substrate-binding protein [Deltaproteobacteria bacterium]|nr:MAG: zinc ABC transporter substrate-binding protein [Deltaproteobacteria bacterium]